MTTVTENLDRARKIRDERKELRARYVAALETVSDYISGGMARIDILEANDAARALRAELGGKR